jgi:type 1 glutamine amidotransferase
MKSHHFRRTSIGMLLAGLGLALCIQGPAAAADQAQGKPAAAKKAAKPAAAKDKLPEITADDLQKIEAALPAKATAVPKQPRKLLVFWRCEGFFHGSGIAAGNKAIELLGQKTGAWTTDISREYEVFEPANLAKYDAVAFNNTTHLEFPDEQKKQALLSFVRGGKGLVGIHSATDNFYTWPEAAEVMGGLFSGHPWHGNGTWAFKLDEPDHVLLRAFAGQGFKLQDEIYQFKAPYTRADRRVLLSLDLSDADTGKVQGGRTDNDYAVAWIKNVGKGRVFYCSLGHAGNVFQAPAVVRFYLDGIQFALGDLEADATPKK